MDDVGTRRCGRRAASGSDQAIKLKNNPKLWFTEILWSFLRNANLGDDTNWKVEDQLDYLYVNAPLLKRLKNARVPLREEVFDVNPRLIDHLPIVCKFDRTRGNEDEQLVASPLVLIPVGGPHAWPRVDAARPSGRLLVVVDRQRTGPGQSKPFANNGSLLYAVIVRMPYRGISTSRVTRTRPSIWA